MKRILALIASVIITISGSSVTLAESSDAWMPSTTNVGEGKTSFFIAEDSQGNSLSTRIGMAPTSEGSFYDFWCETYTTKECSLANDEALFRSYAVLPVCQSPSQENCVQELTLKIANQGEIKASFVKNVEGIRFSANPEVGLYEASTISLWDAPNAKAAGGTTTYAVNVRTYLEYNKWTRKFETVSMTSAVLPYRFVTGDFQTPVGGTVQNAKGSGYPGSAIWGIRHECVWNDSTGCGVLQNFSAGTVVTLSSRVPKRVGGWFKGRMTNPVIDVREFSKSNNLITVSAEPVDVARLQTTVSQDLAPENIESVFYRSGVMGSLWSGAQAFRENSGDGAFEYLDLFKPFTKDTAAGVSNLWSFGSVPNGTGSDCLSDTSKVLGIVTTNAMVYDGAAPEFDGLQLSYRVGGLHWMPNGQDEVLGKYDLVMRSSTARCLYGFSAAPISVSITVTNSTGENKVATTTFRERNGWVHLGAYGFTFSEPTVKIKMTQKRPVSKIKSLTCLKGSKSIVIKGTKPKCPSGFKAAKR